jgi:hypothetical protein
LAATRSTGASNNEDLAKNIYAALFDTGANQSIGMAMISGKTLYSNNNLMYALFGDPSIRLVNQARSVDLAAYDSMGVLRDTLKSLQRVTVKGTIVDNSGNADQSFGAVTPAFVQIGLFNPPEIVGRKDNGADDSVKWVQPGKPLFSGTTPIRNGAFEQTLLIPLDLTFNKSGVKLSAYAWEGNRIASGYRKSIIFNGGGVPDGKTDSTGPCITVRPVYEVANMLSTAASFSDRICSSLPLDCEIELNDPNGINVMGTGPDEGLTIEVPGVMSRRNINHKFQFAEGDYRRGVAVVSFEEKSLEIGSYTFIITSRDLLGNVSKAAIALEITDENEPTLDRTFNTPNPVRMGRTTRFFFYPSTAQPYLNAHFMIKVFSLSGKLLKVFKNACNGEIWDLTDQSGYPLPPNIYLYQVSAYYYTTGKQVKSKIQKLVIHPPR